MSYNILSDGEKQYEKNISKVVKRERAVVKY